MELPPSRNAPAAAPERGDVGSSSVARTRPTPLRLAASPHALGSAPRSLTTRVLPGGGAHTRTPSALPLSTVGTLVDSARQWQRMLRRGGSERAARTLRREPRALTPAGFLRALCAATAWT